MLNVSICSFILWHLEPFCFSSLISLLQTTLTLDHSREIMTSLFSFRPRSNRKTHILLLPYTCVVTCQWIKTHHFKSQRSGHELCARPLSSNNIDMRLVKKLAPTTKAELIFYHINLCLPWHRHLCRLESLLGYNMAGQKTYPALITLKTENNILSVFFMNYLTYLVNITAVTAWRTLKTLFPKQTTIAVILKTFHSLQCFVNTFTNT